MPKIREIVLGRWQHWLLFALLVLGLYVMGESSLHTRRFALFAIVLVGLVCAVLAVVVWDYQADQDVTREAFGDAALPHQVREVEEV